MSGRSLHFSAKSILLVIASAIAGFGIGLTLPFHIAPTETWQETLVRREMFALNVPGLYLFSPFAQPGMTVWMIPIGNAVAYALIATFLILAIGVMRQFRNNATVCGGFGKR